MSCPSELTLSIYVDGELAAADRRPFETHLIGCQACRARVVGLREEAELLSDALLERERQPARLPARRPPAARGLALGAAPSLGAAALIAAVLGWLLETRLVPSGIGWLNPFRFAGVYDMAFDFVFMVRDEAPELLSLGVTIGATLSVSAILTFALTAVSRRWAGPGSIALALALLLAPSPSEAHFGLHEHDDYDLAAGETHDGTLLVSGKNVNIDGIVDGDLIVASRRLAVRGEVRGNIFAFVRTAEIAGSVNGTVTCICSNTRIDGEIDADFYNLSSEFVLSSSGRIARNATIATDDGVIEGSIGRDLVTASDRMEVRGSVARNVDSWDRLWLRDTARIGGNVSAVLHNEEDIQIDAGAVIAGETLRKSSDRVSRHHLARYREPSFYLLIVIGLAAAFLVGMVLHRLFPRAFGERLETPGAFFRALGLGFVALVATPILLCVLALTLAGIPLALIGFGAYLTAIYLSGVLVAGLVGSALVHSDPTRTRSFGLSFLVGVLVVGIVAHLPFLGVLVHVLVVLTGLGLIVQRAWDTWGRPRSVAG